MDTIKTQQVLFCVQQVQREFYMKFLVNGQKRIKKISHQISELCLTKIFKQIQQIWSLYLRPAIKWLRSLHKHTKIFLDGKMVKRNIVISAMEVLLKMMKRKLLMYSAERKISN